MTRAKARAFKKLNIPADNRLILSLDGGGIRGIMTLQLLRKLEETAGMACYKFCDMVAGTSTGGIIAGLIALGKSATDIEKLYVKLVKKVFKKRHWSAHRFASPPQYTKKNFPNYLRKP